MKNTLLRANLTNAYFLMRLHKPIGFWLLLWPSLMGLWLASDGWPASPLIVIYIAGAFIMRSAGCVINDLADRKFDAQVARTKMRPLASKQSSVVFAVLLLLGLLSAALFLWLQLNHYAQMQAIIALLLACLYPFTKRIFHAPQVILGVSFAWSIPIAFAQIRHSIYYLECWLLFASIVAWVIAYDTQYALNDLHDDIKIGLKSSAIFFGKYVTQIIWLLQALSLMLFMAVGMVQNFNLIFFIGALMSSAWFIYQDFLLKNQQYLLAFNQNHLVGITWFLLILFASWEKIYLPT